MGYDTGFIPGTEPSTYTIEERLRIRIAELEAERDSLREDAKRWRWFVLRKTFWRGPRCIQFGGEASTEIEGGPGRHDLKKQAMDAMVDKARAALEGE